MTYMEFDNVFGAWNEYVHLLNLGSGSGTLNDNSLAYFKGKAALKGLRHLAIVEIKSPIDRVKCIENWLTENDFDCNWAAAILLDGTDARMCVFLSNLHIATQLQLVGEFS